ncbi:hypothetical protein [Microseira sp. BLCC-F43]|uniref:hypothetical protein n=1 Tax=Microseira sp. BLCC-F43 TaxID=3153602 RepID=UPI0035B85815
MWQSKYLALAPLSLAALLGLGGSVWLANGAKAQPVSQADTARVNLFLNRQPNESYDTFIRRAEAVVTDAAIRTFNQNPSSRAVAVTVVGQNEGSAAPILSLEVNRQDWARNPSPQRWATYFKSARSLLRLDNTAANTPNVAPTTATPLGTPGQAIPNGTAVPGNGLGQAQVIPSGAIVPAGLVLGQQQVLPNGTIVVPTIVPGQVLPNGTVVVPGTVPGQLAPNGTTGTSGTPGTTNFGNTGTPGTTNFNGTTGTPGTTNFGNTGTPGTTNFGNTGTPGTTNFNGTTGTTGTTNFNGTTGTTGTGNFNGTNGTTGTGNFNGTTGTPGTGNFNGTNGSTGNGGIRRNF